MVMFYYLQNEAADKALQAWGYSSNRLQTEICKTIYSACQVFLWENSYRKLIVKIFPFL